MNKDYEEIDVREMPQEYLENAYNYLLRVEKQSGRDIVVMEEPKSGYIETATFSELNEGSVKMLKDEIDIRKNEKRVVREINGEEVIVLER